MKQKINTMMTLFGTLVVMGSQEKKCHSFLSITESDGEMRRRRDVL